MKQTKPPRLCKVLGVVPGAPVVGTRESAER